MASWSRRAARILDVVRSGAPARPSVLHGSRALAARKGQLRPADFEGAEVPFLVYPREELGIDPNLNWSLIDGDVTPLSFAYRNLHLEALLQRASGTVDASRTLHATVSSSNSAVRKLVLPGEGHLAGGFDVVDGAHADRLRTAVKAQLSESHDLYVNDAALNSHPAGEVSVRIVSDDPNTSLYCKNLLVRTRVDDSFSPAIQVYVVPSLTVDGEAAALVDVQKGEVIIAGTADKEVLRNSLSFLGELAIAHSSTETAASVPMAASAFMKADKSTAVVAGDAGIFVNAPLYANNGVVLSDVGVSFMLGGVSFKENKKSALAKGSYVENGMVTSAVLSRPNVANHASTLVLCHNGAAKALPPVATLAPKAAVSFAGVLGSLGTSVNPTVLSERLVSYLESHSVQSFLVDTAAKDAKETINAIVEGRMNTKDFKPVLGNVLDGVAAPSSYKSGKTAEAATTEFLKSKLAALEASML